MRRGDEPLSISFLVSLPGDAHAPGASRKALSLSPLIGSRPDPAKGCMPGGPRVAADQSLQKQPVATTGSTSRRRWLGCGLWPCGWSEDSAQLRRSAAAAGHGRPLVRGVAHLLLLAPAM